MRLYVRPIFSLVSLLFWSYVVWTWVTWLRSTERYAPKWRAATAVAGLGSATVSTVLSAFLSIRATVTGGFPFYRPVELFCIRLGSLTALLGLVAAMAGKGETAASRCRNLGSESPDLVQRRDGAIRMWPNSVTGEVDFSSSDLPGTWTQL